ncbi:PHP domain-containing protein ['Paenibacillus yunnanensis' Narsing Rao et al. 2020]|uniref:PHP domain-containing protein n=1 Tax=Paenibacillus tengchongensis TaxID=2608684 RepID=UPI0016521740|nr:PHP domain-containing protein [Paenibacillus tengchongensis]
MCKIDLHIHTCHSDGAHTPSALIGQLEKSGVEYASFTDHNQLTLPADSSFHKVKLVNGAEFSVSYEGKIIHILGYKLSPCAELDSLIKDINKIQSQKILKVLFYLSRENVKLDYSCLKVRHANLNEITRQLIQKGYVANKKEAFSYYLDRILLKINVEAAVPVENAIACIHASGGFAVLAHPMRITRNMNRINSIFSNLIELGINGMECFYPKHTQKETSHLIEMTNNKKLIISGGSDYHGVIEDSHSIDSLKGLEIPYEYRYKLIERFFV